MLSDLGWLCNWPCCCYCCWSTLRCCCYCCCIFLWLRSGAVRVSQCHTTMISGLNIFIISSQIYLTSLTLNTNNTKCKNLRLEVYGKSNMSSNYVDLSLYKLCSQLNIRQIFNINSQKFNLSAIISR